MSWSISIVATDVQSAIQTIERGERGAHGIPKEAENALIAALKTMPQKRALFIEGSGYRDELLHWGSFTLTIKPVEIAEAHDAHALHGRAMVTGHISCTEKYKKESKITLMPNDPLYWGETE